MKPFDTHPWNIREVQLDTGRLHVMSMAVNDPAYAEETQAV